MEEGEKEEGETSHEPEQWNQAIEAEESLAKDSRNTRSRTTAPASDDDENKTQDLQPRSQEHGGMGTSKEPPGTPVKREEQAKEVPNETATVPLLLDNSGVDTAEELPGDITAITDTSFLQDDSPLEITSPYNNDDQQSMHSMTMPPPQSFTGQVPENVMHSAQFPAAAPLTAPGTHLQSMDLSAMARASMSSAASNGFHHPANGLVAYPNGEVGIPHMPPLVLPQSNGGYHHGIPATLAPAPPSGGKRRIQLRLVEDVYKPDTSLFSSFRKRSILRKSPVSASTIDEQEPSHMPSQWVERGNLTLSWYEGTSSLELQEHVRNSVIRKLRLKGTTKLADFRILDETVDPPEGKSNIKICLPISTTCIQAH
jgi:hypothetical protein